MNVGVSGFKDAPKGEPGFVYGARREAHKGPWILAWMPAAQVWWPVRWVADRNTYGNDGEWVTAESTFLGHYVRLPEEPTDWLTMPEPLS